MTNRETCRVCGRDFEPEAGAIRAGLLAQMRALAARRDPPHADTYAVLPLARWREGADVAAQLLLEHRIHLLYLHAGRGDRRTHTRSVYALLNFANEIDIVAGLTWLLVANQILDDDPRKGAEDVVGGSPDERSPRY
jgi:hypothetical protein